MNKTVSIRSDAYLDDHVINYPATHRTARRKRQLPDGNSFEIEHIASTAYRRYRKGSFFFFSKLVQHTEWLRQRAYHDLVTLPGRKPIVGSGPPGYSAVSGHRVTIFGVTGFLGRYLVSKLGQGTFPWRALHAFLTILITCCRKNGDTSRYPLPRRGGGPRV